MTIDNTAIYKDCVAAVLREIAALEEERAAIERRLFYTKRRIRLLADVERALNQLIKEDQ
jgi:hypothetical protein